MRISSVELIEINLPLVHFFETSFGRTYERRIILVRVTDADGAEGWGEITCGERPGYSSEWTGSAWVTVEKILAPMVLGREFERAANVFALMSRVRGHRMAKAGIEMAVWDLEAKRLGIPLWRQQKTGGDRNEQVWIRDPDENRIEVMEMVPHSKQNEAIARFKQETTVA